MATPITVAVWEESFASQSTGYSVVNATPVVNFLNDGDHGYDFLASTVTKAQVESGIVQTNDYDVFIVGGREYVRWSDLMASEVKDFVLTGGGGYVGMGWGVTYSTMSLSASGYADLTSFQPTTQTNWYYYNQSGMVDFVDLSHPIADGLDDFTPTQSGCCGAIVGGDYYWDPREGADLVALNGGRPLIIADDSGNGRGVYFGVNIGSYNLYSDTVDDATERLLENAIYWSANANPIPEPATMLLFGSGLLGLAGVQRKMKK